MFCTQHLLPDITQWVTDYKDATRSFGNVEDLNTTHYSVHIGSTDKYNAKHASRLVGL